MPADPGADPAAVVVRESVRVELAPPEAFRLFTDGIDQWWPLGEGYTYGGDRAARIFLEATEGGRFYERFVDGDEFQVGTVRVCSPPHRILFTWRSPEWPAETEVDVRFVADGGGTTVHLAHSGFERLGPEGASIARRWEGGWPRVVQAFATRATGRRGR
jgi:uncharacterized protein YndB with AHSA1/START domain